MSWSLVVMGLALAAASGTAVVLALRLGAMTAAQGQAATLGSATEKQLVETAHEFASYKQRTDAQLEAARRDVEELERDLEACSTPGARRARLAGLLGKLSPRSPTADPSRRTGGVSALAGTGAAGRDPGSRPG